MSDGGQAQQGRAPHVAARPGLRGVHAGRPVSPAGFDPAATGRGELSPDDLDSCPGCGGTAGVERITGTPPRVVAWRCGECGMEWAISRVDPRPTACLDGLAASVELDAVLLEVIVLAAEQSWLSNEQLRERLVALADRVLAGAGP